MGLAPCIRVDLFAGKQRAGRIWALMAAESPHPITLVALRRQFLEAFDEGLTQKQVANTVEKLRVRGLSMPVAQRGRLRGVWEASWLLGALGQKHRDFGRPVRVDDYLDLFADSDL